VLWLAYIRDDEKEAGGADQIIRLCVSGGELQRFGGGVDDLHLEFHRLLQPDSETDLMVLHRRET
jgi:hypothetical protein